MQSNTISIFNLVFTGKPPIKRVKKNGSAKTRAAPWLFDLLSFWILGLYLSIRVCFEFVILCVFSFLSVSLIIAWSVSSFSVTSLSRRASLCLPLNVWKSLTKSQCTWMHLPSLQMHFTTSMLWLIPHNDLTDLQCVALKAFVCRNVHVMLSFSVLFTGVTQTWRTEVVRDWPQTARRRSGCSFCALDGRRSLWTLYRAPPWFYLCPPQWSRWCPKQWPLCSKAERVIWAHLSPPLTTSQCTVC